MIPTNSVESSESELWDSRLARILRCDVEMSRRLLVLRFNFLDWLDYSIAFPIRFLHLSWFVDEGVEKIGDTLFAFHGL